MLALVNVVLTKVTVGASVKRSPVSTRAHQTFVINYR